MSLSIGELVGYVDLDTSKAEQSSGKVDGIVSKLGGSLKAGLAGIAVAAGGAIIAGVKTGMENEAASDKLAASLGLNSKDAQRLGDVAGRVYSNGFGAGLEDVNTAMGAVITSIKGMRGASDKQVQAMTEKAMTYADIMGVDVTRAAQVAGNMVSNNLAKNGSEAFDLLMKASQKVPVQLREDVLDAADEYGQFFNQLGIDGPQAMGMLAEGAKKGMYGIDKAGDAIKEFTIRATDGSDATQSALEGIGLNATKMSNDILAGGNRAHKATDKIVDGLLSIKDPTEQGKAALALFGTPLEDLGTKDIPVFLRSLRDGEKSLGKFGGSVDKAGKTAYDNAQSNLTVFWRTLKTGFVEFIGDKVLPAVDKLAKFLAKNLGPAIDKLAGWFRDKLLPAFKRAADDVMPTLKDAFREVKKALDEGKPAFKLIGDTITKVVIPAAAWLIKKVLPHMAKQFRLVIGGAGKLVKGLSKAWDKIRSGAKALGGFFTKTLPGFFTKAWEKVKNTTSNGVSKVVGWVKGIPGKFASGLSSLRSKLVNIFSNAMGAAKAKVTGIGGTVLEWIRAIPGKIANLGGEMGKAGRGILQDFIDGMKNAAGIISGIAGNVWNTVQGLINGAIDRINAALEFTIDLPGPKNLNVNIANIPHLATGGRAYPDGRVVKIADGGKPETVLTDPQIRALLSKARDAGRGDVDRGPRGPLIGQVVQRTGESADALAERLWFKTRTRG